ncbi:unnamed protein product [Periconia digitata]|uniref:Uncharacterized protein n=1 Tax=Periconia digitata TaxID=1303443 RepID=A0A9W4UKZ3_9PLEO|nr:unnamed protein product [Periconia digitata]
MQATRTAGSQVPVPGPVTNVTSDQERKKNRSRNIRQFTDNLVPSGSPCVMWTDVSRAQH